MKKNKMMRIASVLLVAVLLSTCAISGTFAKYTTTVTGTATAKVATWNVAVAGATETFTFNLFDTLKDSNTTDTETDVDTSSKIIAPGTSGSFAINITNSSEVNAKYSTVFTVKVDGTATEETALPFTFDKTGLTGNLAMNSGSATIDVDWVWDFLETDAANAADMALAGKTITVEVDVPVEQVD